MTPSDSSPDRQAPERQDRPVTVVGGALTGAMMTLYLARRGYPVEMYEMREDIRQSDFTEGRSINLALSTRGLAALDELGLAEACRQMCIPMYGRMIHDRDGDLSFQPYGQEGQHINSVSRRDLTRLLVEHTDRHANTDVRFRAKCLGVDLQQTVARFEDQETGERFEAPSRLVVGADGAYSAVRETLRTSGQFDYQQEYLPHGYKELTIPPVPEAERDGSQNDKWRLEPNALHIWPRNDFMFIALPNPDGSFTGTLFLPLEGPHSFEGLDDGGQVEAFFARHFPDAVDMMPDLAEEFAANPTGSLVTIRCNPFHHDANVLLAGDAAHAVVPFYGQGMNASFEDCQIFDELLDKFDDDFARALPAFTQRRKPDADAIADLALYNYVEMRSKVADESFLLRKKLERALQRAFPRHWRPLYSMVTFSTMPYAEAKQRAEQQDRLLDAVLPEKILKLAAKLTD